MMTFEAVHRPIHTVTTNAAAAHPPSPVDYHHYHHPQDSQVARKKEDQTFILAKTSKEISSFRTVEAALNKFKIIVRKIYETNALYICSENDWQEKVSQYMKENTDAYRWIGSMTNTTRATEENNTLNDSIQHLLKNVNQQIISTLDHLLLCRAITREQYEQMMLYSNQTDSLQVNELYFIPKLYEVTMIFFGFKARRNP